MTGRVEPDGIAPLKGFRLVSLAVNVPGPVAAARLREMGAAVAKVEPPEGDPLATGSPAWYQALTEGQDVVRLNLKEPTGRARLDELLHSADLLLTSTRPDSLRRLGLDWPSLHPVYPHLCQVAIVGYPSPEENRAGHDLTYQAGLGLLRPPDLPRTLLADLAGAEQAVSAALALLLARERGGGAGYRQIALAGAAAVLAAPLQYGLTVPGGVLGGGHPGYGLYQAAGGGWVAVAVLEPHFLQRLQEELDLMQVSRESLAAVFATRTAEDWEMWAAERGLPIALVAAS
ncbi:MAG: CoA transferase [Bacillota bacterium]